MDDKINKYTHKKIEYYLRNMDVLKSEIEKLRELSTSTTLSPTDVGYLISAGSDRPFREKTDDDINAIQLVMQNEELLGVEYDVPCHYHVSSSSVCSVYGFHMSKCPLVQSESFGCPSYDGGAPREILFEERFSQHLNFHYPEIVSELADYLEVGEIPPASLMNVLRNIKNDFAQVGSKDYMNVLMGKNIKKGKSHSDRKPFTARERFETLKRFDFKCRYCGRSSEDGVKLHVDHVIPVSKGGTNEQSNLVAACQDCNLGKGDKNL